MGEMLVRVDRNDRVIGEVERDMAHDSREYIHREVGVVILREDGKVLFQKRALNKRVLPGWWSTGCVGHVQAGTRVRQTVEEEVWEELGKKVGPDIEFLGKEYTEQADGTREEAHFKYWYLWRVPVDFEVEINKEEVEEARFMDLEEINQMREKGEKFYEPFLNVVGMVLSGDNSQLHMEENE